MYPRPDFSNLNGTPIIRKATKECDVFFKNYLLIIATKLRYDEFVYKEQLIIVKAIVIRESYTSGYTSPILSPRSFHQNIWVKFNNSLRSDPQSAPYLFQTKKGQNKTTLVDRIENKHPEYLHSLYCYAIKCLGADDTAGRLSAAINIRSKQLFPDCEERSNLGINRNHFRNFFYKAGEKLKSPTTKPRLTPEHIKKEVVRQIE